VSEAYPELSVEEADRRLAEFRIVDVRESHELDGPLGYIAGSAHVPLAELDGQVAALRDGKPLLLVCRSGNRSGQACAQLCQQGIANPTNLAGGLIAWNRAHLPVERRPSRSADELRRGIVVWLAQVTRRSQAEALDVVTALLQSGGASRGAPSTAALAGALDRMAAMLRESGAPADLDLALQAFRSDLAAL
jgi:rhodanese-related sulfurtransferase